ncbi:MAG: hypothetical protein LBB77_08765 [Treponema sp.]|jgi:hypothetical protein|nr:hypothetical protein [Treponema sp.]
MLTKITPVPITEESIPFAAAAKTCGFKDSGWAEDEYFMSGEANVYTEKDDGKPEPIFSGAPYTTRLLIRRPVDPNQFSGNVIVEILNSTANFDIDRMWVNSWPFFMRNNDIYIGITSKGHVVDSLLKFNKDRYKPINWANPLPDRAPPPNSAGSGPFRFLPQFESGLFWDMLIDLAELLRSGSPENPIRNYQNRYLYLTGWSQSGSYIARIIKSFYNHDKPFFDGYLSAGSGAGATPINAYEPGENIFGKGKLPVGSMMGAKEPVIAINTESENRMVNWYGDFDEPLFKFRTYQIAAASHDTKYNLLDYYGEAGLRELESIGIKNAYYGVDGDPLDYPCEVVFNAAFYHLYKWVREGIPAPHGPKIETKMIFSKSTDPFGSYLENCKDVFGNCKGGIRTPAVDYPTGKYTSFSVTADGSVMPMFGKVNPFPRELLKLLYGNLENYRCLVTEAADEVISRGFILWEDREAFINRVVHTAKARGLD